MSQQGRSGRMGRAGRPGRRVAVTSPQTRLALTRPRSGPMRRQPRLPAAQAELARRLRRRQLRWALLGLGAGCLLVVGVPLVLALAPGLAAVRLAGIPLTWLAVAVLPYPAMVAIAFWQLRGAEHIEAGEVAGAGVRAGRPQAAGLDDTR